MKSRVASALSALYMSHRSCGAILTGSFNRSIMCAHPLTLSGIECSRLEFRRESAIQKMDAAGHSATARTEQEDCHVRDFLCRHEPPDRMVLCHLLKNRLFQGFRHRCPHVARTDRVASNAAPSEVDGCRFGEAYHAVFGGDVRSRLGLRQQA